MADDDADPELLALLRQHFLGDPTTKAEPETGVLKGAEYVYDNSIDVAIDMRSTKNAAAAIYSQIKQKGYSAASWSEAELHPKTKDEKAVAFIFTMDLLNFSFWSDKDEADRFAVSYRDKRWTGYWSLVASLQRALDEGWLSSSLNLPLPAAHIIAFLSSFLVAVWVIPSSVQTTSSCLRLACSVVFVISNRLATWCKERREHALLTVT